jgi:neurofibromin 1
VGFNKSNEPLRYLCLDYMVPWLPNLSLFCHSAGNESNPGLVKTKEVIRLLIDLTVARTDVSLLYSLSLSLYVWLTFDWLDV